MSRPVWVTKGGDLGTYPELEYFSMPLEVYDPTGSPVTFTFLSGELPPGVQVVRTGILQGVPVVLSPISSDETRTYKFTIRATCQTPAVVVDKTFSFTVSNIVPPQIIPEATQLGEFFDGASINVQLRAIDPNPNSSLTWSIKEGSLPPGLTMSSSGLITGFVRQNLAEFIDGRLGYDAQPEQVEVDFTPTANVQVPAGKTTRTETQNPIIGEEQPYDYTNPVNNWNLPYDYTGAVSTNKNYTFTVQVFDGANYDTQTYTIKIIAKSTWKTDNDVNTVDNDFITVDADYKYNPIITTTVTSLPTIRQNSNIAFKFDAIDFYNSTLTWDSNVNEVFGSEMVLDPDTGWLAGHIGLQTEYTHTYTFYVTASNVYLDNTGNTIYYTSDPLVCNLTVLGDINNKIIWNSPSDIGTIVNGEVSEFAIDAAFSGNTNIVNPIEIEYALVHGTLSNGSPATNGSPLNSTSSSYAYNYGTSTVIGLPQGLYLNTDGLIIGRASFRYYRLDSDNTTFDKNKTTFDSTYTFTVQASARDTITNSILVSDTRTFTIKVENLYKKPYENLYVKALTTLNERRLFRDILRDQNMFPDESIYRLSDPNFGKAEDIKFLDLAGVSPNELSSYAEAMSKNHYNKILDFSEIKTAIATDPDNNYAVKYEVVYVDVYDPVNANSENVLLETNLLTDTLNRIKNPHIGKDGTPHYMLMPNSFENMQTRIESALGYSARGVLPDWMTSVQEDKTILGFKRAVVLAYTKPGESKKIAYRIKNRGINLNVINFVADRYLLDNKLTEHYDIQENVFVSGRETTFDYLSLLNDSPYDVVDYSVQVPFSSINNKQYGDLLSIDGVTSYRHGDRLIFAKQENFGSGLYQDGWIYYDEAYIGNYTGDSDANGYYDVDLFDGSYVVPGFNEIQNNKITTLVADAAQGDTHIFVPYILNDGYLDLLIENLEFISYSTLITNVELDNSLGYLNLKLTLNHPLTSNAHAGDKVFIKPYMRLSEVTDTTITISSGLPTTIADKLALIGFTLSGYGIPDGTVITEIIDNVIRVKNPTDTPLSIRPVDYLGYAVSNQRAGIWEINIVDNMVTLNFIKEVAPGGYVKVLNGVSNGSSFMQYQTAASNGDTVPKYKRVASRLSFSGSDGGRTTFDMGGTRFIESRDSAGEYTQPIVPWEKFKPYKIGTIVTYNDAYYRAVRNVEAYYEFTPTKVDYSGILPGITKVLWEKIDIVTTNGDKYLKFPQIGVFN